VRPHCARSAVVHSVIGTENCYNQQSSQQLSAVTAACRTELYSPHCTHTPLYACTAARLHCCTFALLCADTLLRAHCVRSHCCTLTLCTLTLCTHVYTLYLCSRRAARAWLTEAEGIAVPPSQQDFAWVGKLMKRRGGFGKIALNNNNWKYRCFVLTKNGESPEQKFLGSFWKALDNFCQLFNLSEHCCCKCSACASMHSM
jgi:hypothetical protein